MESCHKLPKLNTAVYQNYCKYKSLSIFNELSLEIELINNKKSV